MGANQVLEVCQSQRDCVPEPRVARHELPWGNGSGNQNPNGVSALVNVFHESQPRWGCCFSRFLPRVARASQPWALLRNPFGIQRKDTLLKLDLRLSTYFPFAGTWRLLVLRVQGYGLFVR